eukprot:1150314-Pelagomonas_calceolata.AAC.2
MTNGSNFLRVSESLANCPGIDLRLLGSPREASRRLGHLQETTGGVASNAENWRSPRSTARNSEYHELFHWPFPDVCPCWCSSGVTATPMEERGAAEVP